MNLKDTYNVIAEDWHKDHQNDGWWQKGTDTFLSYLKPGARVLDAGCAGGYKTKYIGERGFRVEGVDFSEKFIEIAKRELPQYPFTQLDLRDVRTLQGLFDGVYISAVLLHLPKSKIQDMLLGFADKLEDDGYLYLAVKEKRPDGAEEEVKREDDYGYAYERFFSYFTTGELTEYLNHAGFEVVFADVTLVVHTNWIQVIAQKKK